MKLYAKGENYTIYNDNILNMLEDLAPNSIDSIVTDPPYHLQTMTNRFGKKKSAKNVFGRDGSFQRLTKGFMGKEWDGDDIAFQVDTWAKCYEVLKPGGYLLAFGGSRTYHRMACAIEDAGFEIRDSIMWLYGSGFPKSHNVALDIDKKFGHGNRGHRMAVASRFHPDGTFEPNVEDLEPYEAQVEVAKSWQGYGTSLKPAYEPIIVARKPLEGTVAENVLKWGVGGINIDDCRIPNDANKGRFPANIIHDGSDEVLAMFPNTKAGGDINQNYTMNNTIYGKYGSCNLHESYDDEGNAARYFKQCSFTDKDEDFPVGYYCAKASKEDRDEGLVVNDGRKKSIDNAFQRGETIRKNTHPTVKPTELMQYLIRLVTPIGGIILDCFPGNGTTSKAAILENRERNVNYKIIIIELEKEYCPIIKARTDYAINKYEYDAKIEQAKTGQLDLFDFMGEII